MPGQTSIGGEYYSVKLKDRKKKQLLWKKLQTERQKNNKDRFLLLNIFSIHNTHCRENQLPILPTEVFADTGQTLFTGFTVQFSRTPFAQASEKPLRA